MADSKKKTDTASGATPDPDRFELVGRDTYTLATKQGPLMLRKGEALTPKLFKGIPTADQTHFKPLAPEASE